MTAVENELKIQKDKMLDLYDENNNLKQEKEEILTKLEEIKSTIEGKLKTINCYKRNF